MVREVGVREVGSRGWARVDGIDLLRGAAIFFVLMNHVNMQMLFAKVPYLRGMPAQLVYTLVWNGQLGVQMFFAVSGYLITSTSMRRWGSLGALKVREFYWLRFARIAPLMILLLCVLSGLDLAGMKHFVVERETGGLGRALAAALTFHINYLEATRGYLPGNWDILWSLSVEEMFYLFFPVVARVLRRERWLVVLLVLFVMAGPFARMKAFDPNPVWREYSYLGGMDAIAMGCLTALLLAGRRLSRAWVWLCGSAGAALLVFCFGFSIEAYRIGLGKSGLLMSVVGLGACLVIAAAAQSGWKAPWVLAPVLQMGQRSYEIYLTHMFVVIGLFAVFVAWGKPSGFAWWVFAAVIVVATALGWAVSAGFSEPMNRWLRRGKNGRALRAREAGSSLRSE
jgi:peptidoglycan/LPS O-acetylase OafA/YrhL